MLSTFSSAQSLVRHVEKIAPRFSVVSLDLFDTLLVRRVADPDSLKPAVARFVAMAAERAGHAIRWEEVQALRDLHEKAQRERNRAAFPDAEARYPDFMTGMLKAVFRKENVAEELRRVTDYELDLESRVLVARPAIADMVQRLHQQGKTIVVMTDMYLPSEHVRRLMDRAGVLRDVDLVVSSADTFHAKASGAGYARLIREQGYEPARWLHIGDNAVSDGLRAEAAGLHAVLLNDDDEKFRKSVYRRYEAAAGASPFWKGRLLQQFMLPLEAENEPRDPLYIHGRNFFGPLICAFVQYLAEQARARKLHRLYFFSREGGTFLKVWERLAPLLFPAGDAPEVRYLYVSRFALAGATCAQQGLTHANVYLSLLPPGNRDMRDMARIFGLDLAPLIPHLARFRLTPETALNSIYPDWTMENRQALDALLSDPEFQSEIRRQTAPRGRLLERYLEQERFFEAPDVAVVDMGWLGTIQRFLYEAVRHRPDKPRFHGFLFGATRGIPFPTQPDNTVTGFLFDGERFEFYSSLVTFALDVIEESCRAPHGGTAGYEEKAGRVSPVLYPDDDPKRSEEMEQDRYFAPLQQGLLDAAEQYAAGVTVLGYSSEDVRPWLNHLLAARLAFPRASEVESLRWKVHFDDFDGAHKPPAKVSWKLKRLWDLPPAAIPFVRLMFYLLYAGVTFSHRLKNFIKGL
ncbi:MAG: HAD family hydrolase [Lentisphaerae bacterium]|nr:HAD family hydrolase [Lentisphaerota bacterium]